MNDRQFEADLPRDYVQERNERFHSSVDLGNATYEQLKALRPDSRSSQILKDQGVLPSVELFDSTPATRLAKSDLRSDHGPAVDDNHRTGALPEYGLAGWVEGAPYKQTKRDNGMIIQEQEDHSMRIRLPHHDNFMRREPHYTQNGNPEKPLASNVKNDGTVIYTYKDGTVESIKPDGTDVLVHKDGSREGNYADGTIFTESKDGHKRWWLPEGSVISQDKHGKVIVEDSNGHPLKPHLGEHGGKQWDTPEGITVTQDKHGNLTWK